jgi:hypothetical protein
MESQIRLAGDLKPGLSPDLHVSSRPLIRTPPTPKSSPQFRPVPPSLPAWEVSSNVRRRAVE